MQTEEIMEEMAARYVSWVRSNLETQDWQRGFQDCLDQLADVLEVDQCDLDVVLTSALKRMRVRA